MSVVTVVGSVISIVIFACTFVFLKCVAFASNAGRHALDVTRMNQVEAVSCPELDVIVLSNWSTMHEQGGSGFRVRDDFLSEFVGARPYLEYFWRKNVSDETTEFALFQWKDGREYESVSGQLELVA
jgi:hypothetical protein